ncbi:MAG TPA: NPCBM/NEW2 domain-containing protein [Verrucomicrobiae bacterium]|nr:NPCBM/NEW2 domain-containing protein [Verrucomicrobiae bacterium]
MLPAQTNWPAPIPCRIQDGDNPDLFVMTLGEVHTPLAQGIFDPVKDEVTLKDGGIRANYYRDVLGVKNYQPLDKTRFPLPPSGWCTWYYYYNRINEKEVKLNADWISKNLKDFGANYVQIDDGWQGDGTRNGGRDWTSVNPRNFPHGMASLATYIKSRGLTPGIWLAPHGQSNPQVVSNNPDVFLLKPDGTSASDTWEGRFLVDPTTPESQNYMKELFTRLAGWDYEYFKIDGQPIVVNEYRSKKQFMKNPSDDNVKLYRETLDSIRSAIGPNRYLLGCWGIPLEGAGIMNGSRTGGDIVLGWGGFQVALRPTMQYYYLHNIVWYSDPDVLCVRSPLTLDQARVWATLEGLTGQALMSSDRLMDLGEDRVELLRRVYPAANIRPLDLFPSERNKRIWDLKIAHLGRKYDVVGVFNFGTDKAEQIRLDWKELGLPADKPVHVFDFWNKEYLGAWPAGFAIKVSPTSCRVLTLLPDSDRIQLISTSRHITQGWVDISAINQNGNAFDGTSKVVEDDPYELRFVFPRGKNFTVAKAVARRGFHKLPVEIFNHQGWAAVRFTSPKTTEVKWEIQFEPSDAYHFPPSEPAGLSVERAGLDGVNLSWREQYYLNSGYQVYLNDELLGYTPMAEFPVRGLNPLTNYTARVKTVAEDGRESVRSAQIKFSIASMVPAELSLTQLEPLHSTGRWRGFEIDEMLSGGPAVIGENHYEHALRAFVNSEAEFDLKGLYKTFSALAGLENSSGDSAAEFIVLGDGKELWRSGSVRGSEAKPVEVDITGIQKLTLRSTSSAGRRTRAQSVWANPTVKK